MKKILVVGKDPKVCEDIRKYFDPQEYTFLSSYDSKSAIASTINLKPDLVILDLNSLGYSGLEVLRRLKESNSNLPVIAITDPMDPNSDSSCDQNMVRIIKEKVYGFVERPIQPEKLSSLVKEALSASMSRMVYTTVTTGEAQRELKEVTKASGLLKSPEREKSDCAQILEGTSAGEKDYHQIFEELLTPIFDEVIVGSKGNIYDHLISGLEKCLLSLTLKYCNHNQVKASQILGISRNTLRERIKRYDLW
jgi:DNA-binding NtrC family response regulator